MVEETAAQRLDKWLWCARFFKTRSLATKMLGAGRARLDGNAVEKAHQKIKVGAVLTFPQGPHIRVVKVLALGERRGPAPEAQTLYEDLAPPEEKKPEAKDESMFDALSGSRDKGAGRPTKRDRRAIDRLLDG